MGLKTARKSKKGSTPYRYDPSPGAVEVETLIVIDYHISRDRMLHVQRSDTKRHRGDADTYVCIDDAYWTEIEAWDAFIKKQADKVGQESYLLSAAKECREFRKSRGLI